MASIKHTRASYERDSVCQLPCWAVTAMNVSQQRQLKSEVILSAIIQSCCCQDPSHKAVYATLPLIDVWRLRPEWLWLRPFQALQLVSLHWPCSPLFMFGPGNLTMYTSHQHKSNSGWSLNFRSGVKQLPSLWHHLHGLCPEKSSIPLEMQYV